MPRVSNDKKISVIIGNPPYNAKQANFNDQNANRKYPAIDKRIKETYIKEGTAQNQMVLYDPYIRFYRWATDRLDKNGVLTFITNRSFVAKDTFDGFRKELALDFNEIYIIDTKSDVRDNPKIAGTTHNVFGIKTGVCVAFLVRNEKLKDKSKIYYHTLQDEQLKQEKLDWFSQTKWQDIPFERIIPDEKGHWLNLTDNDFDTLIPVLNDSNESIFNKGIKGLQSKRQDWVYDVSKDNLVNKMEFFIKHYNSVKNIEKAEKDSTIKWSRELLRHKKNNVVINLNPNNIILGYPRPFAKRNLYLDKTLISYVYNWDKFIKNTDKRAIVINNGSVEFAVLASNFAIDEAFLLVGGGSTQCLPFNYLDNTENITDWALSLFREHLSSINQQNNKSTKQQINKEDIFHYVYAVLHLPAYRQKYEQNLKRDFPRIPLYADFWKFAEAGKALMELHLAYETVQPYPLTVSSEQLAVNSKKTKVRENQLIEPNHTTIEPYNHTTPKAKLKANKEAGEIQIDEQTTLRGIPAEAWQYKLGNRSALEWILDQYKESTPSDATIAEKFNTYRFADYKEQVIDLLMRVCTVSVETMKIVEGLKVEG